jgi:methylthioribulose-1-phosphate dehydratase
MQIDENTSLELRQRAAELCAAGRELYAHGMAPATSGNLSTRFRDGRILITVSGTHKGRLEDGDLMLLDESGQPEDQGQPSAETALHLQIYRRLPEVNAVLHPHSIHATLLSRSDPRDLILENYELLKALPGITGHATRVTLPVFANDQNIDRLADGIDAWMDRHGTPPGYLISGHGFYTWGDSISAALHHVEALEFLFDCELRLRGASGP